MTGPAGRIAQPVLTDVNALWDRRMMMTKDTDFTRKPYVAHIRPDREQLLIEHLKNTAVLAERFAESFHGEEFAHLAGMLHDIGKYSEKFQHKIRTGSNDRVDHSTAGAKVCREIGGAAEFLSYCIAGHHAGLPDLGGLSDPLGSSTLYGRMKKQIEDFSAYICEVSASSIKQEPFDFSESQDPSFSVSFFLRMIYSCLTDADFLDTELFMRRNDCTRDPGETLLVLFSRLQKYIRSWLMQTDVDTVNGRRTEILKACMDHGSDRRGLFRLTVPTGGGKTVSSLTFALSHAVQHGLSRIIYVVPYTSIIEQTAAVFREILGERNILEHHGGVVYRDGEELNPWQLAAENWDKPVIVTTNVQFFESLFSNRSSSCRKLHNIADSVIVFDEAQMLPTDYLIPCTAAMDELMLHYGCSLVLCTATQPSLAAFFKDRKAVELCPRMEEQFLFFRRASFRNLGLLSEQMLIDYLCKEHQALCIVNTRKRAQALYRQLKNDGVFCLSTAMYPKHRRRVLSQVRKRLSNHEKCILISTSLVEAGVDLDFISVYRELAGLDSVIQAGGRWNRASMGGKDASFVSLFSFADAERVPGQDLQIDIAKLLLQDGADLLQPDTTSVYFDRLYRNKSSLDKKNIMDCFADLSFSYRTASERFHLIEDASVSVFIDADEESHAIFERLQRGEHGKQLRQMAEQYCVSVYENDLKQMPGMKPLCPEYLSGLYLLTDLSRYTFETGLVLTVPRGEAMIV